MEKKISAKLVFVVEDDLPSFQLIEELFADKNVSLVHFMNGRNLISRIGDGEKPDLVIMDIQLPGADGLELTRQIKATEPSIPVVAYTSYAMPGDRERCFQAGCNGYVSKPINVDIFMRTVSKYL